MSFAKRHLDLRTRLFFAVGNICLFTGVTLSLLGQGFGARHPASFDFLRALLIGNAICLNFWAARRAGHCS